MKRIIGMITLAIATVLAAGAVIAPAASASGVASASIRPVVLYVGWSSHSVKPNHFYDIGDASLTHLHWTHWTHTAYARGVLCVSGEGAPGAGGCLVAGVTLSHIKIHNGTRYFATMKISTQDKGRHLVTWLVMGTGGHWQYR